MRSAVFLRPLAASGEAVLHIIRTPRYDEGPDAMRGGSCMNWVRLQPAHPTLRGLAVDGDSPVATTRERILYPWQQVGRLVYTSGVSVWTIYDDDGRDRAEDGRTVRLTFNGTRPNKLAAAAQTRRFRGDWHDGRLALTERYDAARREAWQLIGLLVVLGILFAAMAVMSAVRTWRSGDLSQLQLERQYWVLLAAVCLMWAVIAAAGAHNILVIGPPGSGKTMLSRRMPTILPRLTIAESLEMTRIYSAAGKVPAGASLNGTG